MVAGSVVTGALLSKHLSFVGSERSGLAVITVMKVEFFVRMVYPVRSVSINRRSCTALTHKKFRVWGENVQNWRGCGTFCTSSEIFACFPGYRRPFRGLSQLFGHI